MYQVLIVDDEPRILKGINKTFEWEANGFEVIGEVSNPAAAYDIICKKKPHVVFTDICMPVMNGVELMKKTRENGIDIEFIIISGYSDFEYAQESIRFGAFGYLLKPLNRKEANDLLKKLLIHLEKKYNILKRDIYDSIYNNTDYIEKLREMSFKCKKNKYLCAVDNKNLFHLLLENKNMDMDSISIDIGNERYLHLINFDTGEELIRELKCDTPGYIAGISSVCLELSGISKISKEANTVFLANTFYKQINISCYCKPNISMINNIIKQMINVIDTGDQESLVELADRVPDACINRKLYLDDLCFIYNAVFSYVNIKFSDKLINFGIPYMQLDQALLDFENVDNFVCFLKEIVKLLFCEDRYINEDADDNNFVKLLEYVKNNFCNCITLKDVAVKFFLNYSYTCTLFKKNTGSNFMEYLNNLRMKKAVELIKTGKVSLSEIHSMVGYNDYYYFNKVFKKYYNMTPNQYKASI